MLKQPKNKNFLNRTATRATGAIQNEKFENVFLLQTHATRCFNRWYAICVYLRIRIIAMTALAAGP